MAEDLQGLLQRIKDQGFQQGEAERAKLTAEARRQAEAIVAQARADSERLVSEARQESTKLVQAGEDKLRQAARDVVIALEAELRQVLAATIKTCAAQALTPDLLAQLILTLAKAYGEHKGEVTRVELLVPEARLADFDRFFQAQLGAAFREGVRLTPVRGIDAGLQISFNGEAVFHDFSADAITDMLCAYANPRLAALLRP